VQEEKCIEDLLDRTEGKIDLEVFGTDGRILLK
jgi:hypothetical protein